MSEGTITIPALMAADQALMLARRLIEKVQRVGVNPHAPNDPIDLGPVFAFLGDDVAREELQGVIEREESAS